MENRFEIFASAPPGLEDALLAEVTSVGFTSPDKVAGGVTFQGDLEDVYRANLWLRGAGRILMRIGSFRAFHLAQLDKRARKFPWGEILRPDIPVRVDVTCKNSKIYHDRAARQRIERAITEELGAKILPEAEMRIMVRIEDDLVGLSIDSSGEPLHRRGHKEAVGKAPMRETLAALFLRACGYDGTETVVDPMCGSGTFVLEAAEIAAGLAPGRSRRFAFEDLACFDPSVWAAQLDVAGAPSGSQRHFGSDRDDGAIRMSTANAQRAGVSQNCEFARHAISDLQRPEGPPGLVIVNPPYGARIGNRKLLFGLYGALGQVLSDRFSGWRVGMVTSDGGLAKATGFDLKASAPVSFGGLQVKLYQTLIR